MIIEVSQPPTGGPMSTVWTGEGVDEAGRTVTFGGDWRPMRDLAAYVEENGPVSVELESWQILGVSEPQPEPVVT